jgi:hypothetical protein
VQRTVSGITQSRRRALTNKEIGKANDKDGYSDI